MKCRTRIHQLVITLSSTRKEESQTSVVSYADQADENNNRAVMGGGLGLSMGPHVECHEILYQP